MVEIDAGFIPGNVNCPLLLQGMRFSRICGAASCALNGAESASATGFTVNSPWSRRTVTSTLLPSYSNNIPAAFAIELVIVTGMNPGRPAVVLILLLACLSSNIVQVNIQCGECQDFQRVTSRH